MMKSDQLKLVVLTFHMEINKNLPKYRNPNSEETWSGHGRKPEWMKDLLLSGKSLDDLIIK